MQDYKAYDADTHMKKLASQVASSQGGASKGGGQSESFDKNRGSDKGGSNAPTSTNAK
jgi:hypothetical protein